jgi:hypothetical protein
MSTSSTQPISGTMRDAIKNASTPQSLDNKSRDNTIYLAKAFGKKPPFLSSRSKSPPPPSSSSRTPLDGNSTYLTPSKTVALSLPSPRNTPPSSVSKNKQTVNHYSANGKHYSRLVSSKIDFFLI